MSEEIHELAVRLTPQDEGATEMLEDTATNFDEVADRAEDSADKLDRQAKEFRGAMSAILGGLSLAATGLLSQVPVIGENMSALGAVITSLSLKLDQDLRPTLNASSDAMFDLAEDIDEAEGSGDALIKTIRDLNIIWQATLPLSPLRLAVEGRAELNDLLDDLDELDSFGDDMPDLPSGGPMSNFTQRIRDRISAEQRGGGQGGVFGFLDRLERQIDQKTASMRETLSEWRRDTRTEFDDWGDKITTGFDETWRNVVAASKRRLNQIASAAETRLNEIIDEINRIAGINLDPVSIGRFQDVSASTGQDSASGGGSGAQAQSRSGSPPPATGSETTIEVDGRTLGRTVAKNTGEGVGNRGR